MSETNETYEAAPRVERSIDSAMARRITVALGNAALEAAIAEDVISAAPFGALGITTDHQYMAMKWPPLPVTPRRWR